MTSQEMRKHEMLMRVRQFGEAHRHLFPARSVAGKLFAAVAAAAEALQQYASNELAGRSGEQEGVLSKATARAALRRQLRAISKTAGAIDAPGFPGKFRAVLDASNAGLLQEARTFLEEAKPLAGTFVAHELPPNFLAKLREGVDALERAMDERTSGRAQREGARGSIEAAMAEGLRAVRRLSAIVPNKLQDPGVSRQWDLARRTERARVRNSGTAASDQASSSLTSSPAQLDTSKPAA
jgi:hypothetical protein